MVDGVLVGDQGTRTAPTTYDFIAQSSTVTVSVVSVDGFGELFDDQKPILSALWLDFNRGNRTLYPSPLVTRVLVDFNDNQGETQVVSHK